jgi:WD40 repeat protein
LSSAFSPDGSRILAISGPVKIWDAQSGAEVLTLKGHSFQVRSAQFSPDGSRIVTGSDTAKVWDSQSGAEVLTLRGHSSGVNSASYSPDGSRIVTGSNDKTVKVWDAQSGAEVLTLKGHSAFVSSASFSPDGSRVVTGSDDMTARVWSARSPAEVVTLNGRVGPLHSVSFSPDGSWILTSGEAGTARIWDARSGVEALTLRVDTQAPVNQHAQLASYSPDGSRVVTGNWDGTVKVWDARRGTEVVTLRGHRGQVHSVSYSPDGSRIITVGNDRTAKVWNAESGAELPTRIGRINGGIASASYSPDGSRIVTGNWDGTAGVWEAESGAEVLTLGGHTKGVVSASFSPDGSRIVTGSADATAKVWNSQSGALVLTLTGHSSGLHSASFSPDASRIVTSSRDATAKIWDAQTGAELLTLKGHFFRVYSASFSPDGSQIVTGGNDGTVKVWDSAPFKENKPVLLDVESAYDRSHYATAARLWAEALAGDPRLHTDGWNVYRGKMARAAALAAAGQGDDAAGLDDATMAKLRRQALEGLSAELSDWTDHIESAPRHARMAIVNALAAWRTDPALFGIRDAAPLAKLPADEQKDWRTLWARVPMPELTTAAPPLNDRSLAAEQQAEHEVLESLASAATQAWFGQVKEYTATCDRVLKVAKDTKSPVNAEQAAKTCSLRASDPKTHEAALGLARRAVELGKGSELMCYFQMALGMAEYRCGHYAEADVALRAAAQLGQENYYVSGTTAFYRAMSLFKQGKEAEARKLASEAVRKMKPLPADEKNPLTGGDDFDDLILWMAFKEASALLGLTR